MIDYQQQFKEVWDKIKTANNILIISHKKPDGDCLGAGCGLANYLIAVNKKVVLFNIDSVPEKFNYLHLADQITNDLAVINQGNFDLVITVDTSSLDYSGVENFLQQAKSKNLLVNIDHHISNKSFGNFNLVVPNASSTSEIVYYLLKNNKVRITKEIANCLLSGIISDSGNFSNAATTTTAITAASQLLISGGQLPKIVKKHSQNQSLASLKLWGKVLARLTKNEKYNITYTYITCNDVTESKIDEEELAGLTDFLNNLSGSKAMMMIKELKPGEVGVSFRTTNNLIDVSKLATLLGGGGHKKAAGFTIKGELVEIDGGVRVM